MNLAFARSMLSSVVIVAIVTHGSAGQEAKTTEVRLIGAWRLVSAEYGGRVMDVARMGTTLKHITPGHFLWVGYDPESKVISRSMGGTYVLRADQYEETVRYGVGGDFDAIRGNLPAKATFTVKVEGDRWHVSGTLDGGLKIVEVWERERAK